MYVKNRTMNKLSVLFLSLSLMTSAAVSAQDRVDAASFANPPAEYHMDIWWHWPNGNISRDGIRKDLETMHSIGIKRATILNVGGSGQFVKRVPFASDEWFGMFRYALEVADSLGMKIGVHNCDGWSTAGGPWISPDKSIKQSSWSTATVKGGRTVTVKLHQPRTLYGFYRDEAVIAYPVKSMPNSFVKAGPFITVDGDICGQMLYDGNPMSQVKRREDGMLKIEFAKPFTAEKLCFMEYKMFAWADLSQRPQHVTVYASQDGDDYYELCDVETKGANVMHSVEIPRTTARFFAVKNHTPETVFSEMELLGAGEKPSCNPPFRNLLTRTLHAKACDKVADYAQDFDTSATAVPSSSVIDLTGMMSEDGTLKWKAPRGRWKIVRFGYTTNGVVTSPASDEGRGLESDKLDASATDFHYASFAHKLVETAGEYAGNTFQFVLVDSWECDMPNWTERFPQEFARIAGYDIRPWIPALCGEIVDSVDATETFVRDYHRTIAELVEHNFYQRMMELAHADGIELHAEPIYGDGDSFPPIDALSANQYCDLPMTEFWATPSGDTRAPAYAVNEMPLYSYPVDAGLIYGKKVTGAEAYTGYAAFSETPEMLKPFGDWAYTSGVNQFILHSYVHQPLDVQPHLTLVDVFGGHYNRNNPWFANSRAWMDYHARIQYVLQHGEPVVDVLYYAGDEELRSFPMEMLGGRLPKGYRAGSCNFDFLPYVPERFNSLYIPEGCRIDSGTAARLDSLAAQGVRIVYDKTGKVLPVDVEPDFTVPQGVDNVLFVHRRLDSQDAYFVFNQDTVAVSGNFGFRVAGNVPQIWDAETGEVSAPIDWHEEEGSTMVKLSLRPRESLLVVFDDEEAPVRRRVPSKMLPLGDVDVHMEFEPLYNEKIAPVETYEIHPLEDFRDTSICYFGGTVTYRIVFDAPSSLKGDEELGICLGKFSAVADMTLNGKPVGSAWHSGQVLRISGLKPVGNVLEVRLYTTLRNRMAGDLEMFGEPRHIATPTGHNLLPKPGDLMSSGIAGPVEIAVF